VVGPSPRRSATVRKVGAPLHASKARSTVSTTWSSQLSTQPNAENALSELIRSTMGDLDDTDPRPQEDISSPPDVAFLFVAVHHAGRFERLVELLHETWPNTKVVAAVGGGVVGSQEEVDQPGLPGMTLLTGNLPDGAHIDFFHFNELSNQPPPPNATYWQDMLTSLPEEDKQSEPDTRSADATTRPPSFLLFADPWSPWTGVLKGLGNSAVVAGGISVAVSPKPTVALNGEALPQGSLVGVRLTGTLGLQTVTSQGCRPIGPVFEISNCTGNTILELNGLPAIEQLDHVAKNTQANDKLLMRNNGYLCGVATDENGGNGIHQDFLVRQIVGFKPDKGGLVVSPAGEDNHVRIGDKVSFHVRDGSAAESDMKLMVERAQTERLFMDDAQKGIPVAALQFSCTARGQSLFGNPNVDLGFVRKLLGYSPAPAISNSREVDDDDDDGAPESKQADDGPAVAGFFANGEFGPVGIGGLNSLSVEAPRRPTFLHGFTTVVTMLCDYSEVSVLPESPVSTEMFAAPIIIQESAMSAWE